MAECNIFFTDFIQGANFSAHHDRNLSLVLNFARVKPTLKTIADAPSPNPNPRYKTKAAEAVTGRRRYRSWCKRVRELYCVMTPKKRTKMSWQNSQNFPLSLFNESTRNVNLFALLMFWATDLKTSLFETTDDVTGSFTNYVPRDSTKEV